MGGSKEPATATFREEEVNPIKDFLSGGFGGVCAVLIGHPLDTIKDSETMMGTDEENHDDSSQGEDEGSKNAEPKKTFFKYSEKNLQDAINAFNGKTMSHRKAAKTYNIPVRLQTMPKVGPNQSPLYCGTFDCASKIIKKEGPLGLYKGMGAPLTGVAPIFALSFFGFGVGKKLQQNNENEKLTYSQLFYAGAFAGIFTTVIMAPGERIKCLLQIQEGTNTKYKGPVDVIKHLYKEGGIRSIFKGTFATLLRDLPASGMYFMTYEAIKDYLTPTDTEKSDLGILTTIFAGGMAGVANWIVGMPPDTLKSRLQTAPEGTYPKGIRDVFSKLIKEEGPTALYRGCTPVMIRAFPANGACFVGYEFAKSVIAWIFPDW